MTHQPVRRGADPYRPHRRLALCCWAFALGTAPVAAAESRIELRDGSVISGDLVGVGNGGYRVRSAALGELVIPESEVLAIRPASAAGPTGIAAPTSATPANPLANPGSPPDDLAAIQQQLLDNPQTLEAITRLQSDPGIQAALADPQLMGLIMSGNVAALSSDPRFQRLMENPAIRALLGRVLEP